MISRTMPTERSLLPDSNLSTGVSAAVPTLGSDLPMHEDIVLPEGWACAKLEGVAAPSKRKIEPYKCANSQYLSLGHIDSQTGCIIGFGRGADVESTKAVFHAGDVLYGKLRPYLNKVCIPDFDGICSTDILVFPKSPYIESQFLMRFLMQPSVVEYANHNSNGIQLPRIAFDKLGELPFPLPPFAEQQRIVAKVEALLARVNAARQPLAKVPAILKRFRQSVLAAACSGRLSADWREENDSVENGEALLGRIQNERSEFIKTAKKRQRIDQDQEDISSEIFSVSWEVPENWTWVPIYELLHYGRSAAYGVLQPGDDIADGVLFVRVCDLRNGAVDPSEMKRIAPEIDRQYPRTRLQGEEVLVTLVGTIGRTAIVPEKLAGANVARAIGMLPLCPHVSPRFVLYALDEPTKNAELVDLAREVARKTLNLGLLKAVRVPLPPLPEQHEIVRRVEALFKLGDAIEKRVRAATARAEKLTQAILAKAFRGELVPTEAELARREGRDYEPASVLLERIRSERAKQTGESEPKPKRQRKQLAQSTKSKVP
jgi:type I restriction enzyme S subunit